LKGFLSKKKVDENIRSEKNRRFFWHQQVIILPLGKQSRLLAWSPGERKQPISAAFFQPAFLAAVSASRPCASSINSLFSV